MANLPDCPICLETLDMTSKMLPCEHTYHKNCLKQMYNLSKEIRCGICRQQLTTITNSNAYDTIEALPQGVIVVGEALRQRRSSKNDVLLQSMENEMTGMRTLLQKKESVIEKYETGLIIGGTVLAGALLGAGIAALCSSSSKKKTANRD